MYNLLKGKKGIITGALDESSIAWKIAEKAYGNGSKYNAIFEANREVIEDPDKIFPGQKIRIPNSLK